MRQLVSVWLLLDGALCRNEPSILPQKNAFLIFGRDSFTRVQCRIHNWHFTGEPVINCYYDVTVLAVFVGLEGSSGLVSMEIWWLMERGNPSPHYLRGKPQARIMWNRTNADISHTYNVQLLITPSGASMVWKFISPTNSSFSAFLLPIFHILSSVQVMKCSQTKEL